jgi:hypothetical protein
MKRCYILEEWNSLANAIFTPATPQIQREETRKAFFAGASIMFHILTRNLSSGLDDVTSADLEILDNVAAEIEAFGKTLQEELKRKTVQ